MSKDTKTVTLRGLLFNRSGRWVAQCVDIDLVAQGSTLEEVQAELIRVICVHVHVYEDAGKDPFKDAPRAPSELVELFEEGWEAKPPKRHARIHHHPELDFRIPAGAY
jgi:predicted RNase H-like HicB family nuclease